MCDGKDLYFHLRTEQVKKQKWLVRRGESETGTSTLEINEVDKDSFNTETTLCLLQLTHGSPLGLKTVIRHLKEKL